MKYLILGLAITPAIPSIVFLLFFLHDFNLMRGIFFDASFSVVPFLTILLMTLIIIRLPFYLTKTRGLRNSYAKWIASLSGLAICMIRPVPSYLKIPLKWIYPEGIHLFPPEYYFNLFFHVKIFLQGIMGAIFVIILPLLYSLSIFFISLRIENFISTRRNPKNRK